MSGASAACAAAEAIPRFIARSNLQKNARLFDFVNSVLFVLIVVLFLIQIVFHPMCEEISIEIALFLVSLKLIMMIHASSRFNHFQFWILHSIETRILALNDRLDALDAKLGAKRDS